MLIVDSAVEKHHPGTQMGVLAMRNVQPKTPLAPELAASAMEAIRNHYGQLSRAELKALHPVKAYVDYYRKFGYSYHVLGQLESVLSGKRKVSNASGLLASMFLSELESMILTAGHDLDTLTTPLTLGVTSGDEQFQSISGKVVATVPGDLMVQSGNTVISSILRGPDLGSRITDATTSVLFTLYAPRSVETSALTSALHHLENRLRSVSPNAETIESRVYPSA